MILAMGPSVLLSCLLVTSLLSVSEAGLVEKTIRLRRQTVASQDQHNISLPTLDGPVIFNHVYNIKVPGSPLCSIDLDAGEGATVQPKDEPASSGQHITEQVVNGENQIVFTHRINIPRRACGCTEDLPGLKELLNRLEVLEGEVSTLRSQCNSGSSSCSAQVTGDVAVKPYCNGHGNYSADTCSCVCVPGWKGTNCTESVTECPSNCHDKGLCVDGKCQCFKGFTGENCSLEVCPVDCGDHGRCVGSICVCSDGFFGENCSETKCLNNCQGRGQCRDGNCECEEPWTGADCSKLICLKPCNEHGNCVNGTCICDEGYTGEDCSERTCPNYCQGNGFCVDGKCHCSAGYSGEDCSVLTCLHDCNGRGTCFKGMCICENGYQGEDCSQLACMNNCNNRGQCINGQCACDVGFQGADCSELSCPRDCRQRGRCVNGQCVCDEGYAGEDCSVKTCPADCHGRGECIKGLCVCHAGFTGADCVELSCPNNCQSRGRCMDGQCVCDEGFSGEDCSQKACPNDCLAQGQCLDGKCICKEGFSGDDCSVPVCPENCNSRGRCINGKCVCVSGYEGESCETLSCLNNCQDKGRCVDGQCVCDEGYIGEDCTDVSPPKNLTVDEVTHKTVNVSWNNEMLVTEYLVTYVPTAPGGLLQEFTVSGDKTSAIVEQLEPGIEYLISVYAVLSNKRSVPVSARVATALPQPEGIKFKSVRETSVEVTWNQLDFTFDGWEIYFRNTKEENGKIVNVVPSNQNQFSQLGLGPGQEYEVSVNIIKNNTKGPQTTKTVTTRIDSPSQVEVKDVTDSSALVIWSQSVGPVDRVVLFYGPTFDPLDRKMAVIAPPDRQYSMDGLRPDTEYMVSLTSSSGNMSSDSVNTTFTTDLDAPKDLQAKSNTDASITLEWTNSEANVSSYRVKYSPLSGASHGEKVFPPGPGNTTTATITGLTPGTEYGVGVTAMKNERESLPATGNTETEIDPPREFEELETTETSVSLQWQKPQAKITGYRLVYFSKDGEEEEVEIPPTATTHVLMDLTPAMSYNLTLTAEKGQKKSVPATLTTSTASFTFYLAGSDNHEIAPPAGSEDNVISFVNLDLSEPQFSGMEPEEDELGSLTVSGVTSDGFDLTWKLKAPSLYHSFTVECKDSQRVWEVKKIKVPGSATGSRIQGLAASTEYEIKLYGVTSSQRSVLLETVAVTAPASTSPLVLAVKMKDTTTTTTATTQSTVDNDALLTAVPLHSVNTEASPTSESVVMSSQPESEKPQLDLLGNLTLTNVTSTNIHLAGSAPDEVLESFVVEQGSPTEENVTALPGNVTNGEIEGLSPSTYYNVTVHGLVEGNRSLPLKVFAATAEELRPVSLNLTISDITWDGFTASWSPADWDFDSFVIEVTNLENFEQSQNLTLSGDAFSLGVSGLNPNTSYLVGLYAMHEGIVLSPVYSEATTVKEPLVGNVYLSNITSESFSIHWNSSEAEFDGFILELIDSDWLMEPVEFNISHNVKTHDVTGLRPSTDYIAYLYGTYKGSRTRAATIVASTAEEPELSRLLVSNITSDRFSLTWRTQEKRFDNFIVEVRESALPSQAMGRALPGDVRSTVMAGLKASTNYNIKLYASSGGQSTKPLFAVATTEDVPKLGDVWTSSVSPHNLSLSWSTVSGHFDGFVIRVSDSEHQSDTLEFRPSGDDRNITISNLMDATDYDIELYGVSHGRHTPSVLTNAVTASLPKVENLTISNITPYGFRVSWEVKQQQKQRQHQPQEDIPPSSGGFSHFLIVVTDSGWLLEPQEFTVPGNQSHMDIWGLITGIGYEVRLTGVSESGLLSRPLTTVAVTEAEPEVDHLFVSDISADSFRLSWAADEDMFDRFVIKIRDSKRLAHPREYSVSGDERTKVLSGLMSGTEYEIELYGVSLDQRSQPITGVAQTGLSTPRGLHFSQVTDSTAIVHWAMPSSLVDTYRVAYLPLEGGSPMTVMVDGTVFEALMHNMIPGRTYQVTVTAVKGLEESDASTDTVTTALDRPQGLIALNVTDTSALLVWQPSVATVDGYIISYTADSVSSVTEQVSGNTVEFEMGSLVPGTHYTVSVHAIKESQRSDSAVTEFSTDVDPPRELKATHVQTDSATLTWKPPQAAVTGYTLTFSSTDGVIREVVLSPTASSYNIAQLTGSTEYSVRLQAVAGAQKSQGVSTVFTTNGKLFQRPRDCAQLLLNGEKTSGLYKIYVGGEEGQPLQVYCDMTTDGGGWLIFLRRQNGKLEFYRNWKNYTAGFGNMNNEFWLGLSNLHKITSSGHYELRVDLRDQDKTAYAQYDKFTIAEPRTRYKLYLGGYSGTAGDSLTYHQGRPFSTYDNDNDIAVTNCALSYKGAFWYKNCHRVNLMGKYGDTSHSKGINWFHWRGHEHSIEFAEMKIRPSNFRNFESRKKRS